MMLLIAPLMALLMVLLMAPLMALITALSWPN